MGDLSFITKEYFKVVDIISQYDDRLMIIKGWSITVGIALIGYAFTQKNKFLLVLCMIAVLCFAIVDAKFKEYQVCYYDRMAQIERCIERKEIDNKVRCISPAINGSWKEAKSFFGIFPQLLIGGVWMPHFVLFFLALFAYRKSKFK